MDSLEMVVNQLEGVHFMNDEIQDTLQEPLNLNENKECKDTHEKEEGKVLLQPEQLQNPNENKEQLQQLQNSSEKKEEHKVERVKAETRGVVKYLNNSGFYLVFSNYETAQRINEMLNFVKAEIVFMERKQEQTWVLCREHQITFSHLRDLQAVIELQNSSMTVCIQHRPISKLYFTDLAPSGSLDHTLQSLYSFLQKIGIHVIQIFTRCAEKRRWAFVWLPKSEEKLVFSVFPTNDQMQGQPLNRNTPSYLQLPNELLNVCVTHAHSRMKTASNQNATNSKKARKTSNVPYPLNRLNKRKKQSHPAGYNKMVAHRHHTRQGKDYQNGEVLAKNQSENNNRKWNRRKSGPKLPSWRSNRSFV